MAAVASAPGPATALTPPSSSHGEEQSWELSGANNQVCLLPLARPITSLLLCTIFRGGR